MAFPVTLESRLHLPLTQAMASADNPILNTPYAEPTRHYATDFGGSVFDLNEFKPEFGECLINGPPEGLLVWRGASWRKATLRCSPVAKK